MAFFCFCSVLVLPVFDGVLIFTFSVQVLRIFSFFFFPVRKAGCDSRRVLSQEHLQSIRKSRVAYVHADPSEARRSRSAFRGDTSDSPVD